MPTTRQQEFNEKVKEIEMDAIQRLVKEAAKLEAPYLYFQALGPILLAYELRVTRREGLPQ